MINNIVDLGYGIIVFGILIGVGSVVLYNFGGSAGTCGTGFTWNSTSDKCWNGTDSANVGGVAYTNTNYMLGKLGSAGLAGWTPAIIAISVGMLILGYFSLNGFGNGTKRY